MTDIVEPAPAPENAAGTPVNAVDTTAPVGEGTTGQAAEVETDEQKNARLLQEREERSRRQYSGIQKRFGELTERAKSAEQREAMLLQLVERLTGQKPDGKPQATDGEPTREQFESYEDFVAARAEYRALQRVQETLSKRERETQQRQQQEAAERQSAQLRQTFGKRVAEYAKTDPEFSKVVARDDVEVPDSVAALLHLEENPGPLLKAFGKNPELLQQFEGKHPVEQAMLLGRLAASLAEKTPQVSNAPAPGKPVAAKSSQADTKPSDNDSVEEWLRKRRAELSRQ